jgi:phage terminase large subunit-like protein
MACGSEWQQVGKCIIGIDLSSTADITAVTYFFPEVMGFFNNYYVPLEKVRSGRRVDGVDYADWLRSGDIIATPGNVIDYDYIIRDIIENCQKYNVDIIGYDPYNADVIIPRFEAQGVRCGAVRQGFLTLSPATKRLERMVLSKEIKHSSDPVMRWMMGNVELETDAAGNIKPSKSKSQNKIDGVASLVTSISAWMAIEVKPINDIEVSMDDLMSMYG